MTDARNDDYERRIVAAFGVPPHRLARSAQPLHPVESAYRAGWFGDVGSPAALRHARQFLAFDESHSAQDRGDQ